MKNKQKSAQILSFISLSILIVLTIIFFVAPAGIEGFSKFAIIIIAPFPLLTALTLSIIAVYFNKRQILGWISLVLLMALFSISIYFILGLKDLPLGMGTR